MSLTDRILLIEYLISALGSAVFVIRYSAAKWWRTAEGRAIMGLHAVLAMFGALTMLRIMYGLHYPLRPVLSLIAVNGLVVATWSLTLLLFRAQRRGKKARSVPEHDRVVVEGDNQKVIIENDGTDPDALKEPVRD